MPARVHLQLVVRGPPRVGSAALDAGLQALPSLPGRHCVLAFSAPALLLRLLLRCTGAQRRAYP